jgi:hypothetical protein
MAHPTIEDASRLAGDLMRMRDTLPMLPAQRDAVTEAALLLFRVRGDFHALMQKAEELLREQRAENAAASQDGA